MSTQTPISILNGINSDPLLAHYRLIKTKEQSDKFNQLKDSILEGSLYTTKNVLSATVAVLIIMINNKDI